ncbi:MAG: hypothetical protein H6623_08205 [Bdellovibrionaceae bacterium]|nr:hypothetical protein [Pseudobdellovibrionaceae bacterium]
MKYLILLSIFSLVACQSRVSVRHPASDNFTVKATITPKQHSKMSEDQYPNLPRLGNFVLIKFIVKPDATGAWNQVEIIDPYKYNFHHEALGMSYEQLKDLSFSQKNRQILLGTIYCNTLFMDADGPKAEEINIAYRFSFTSEEAPSIATVSGVANSLKKFLFPETPMNGDSSVYYRPLPYQNQEVEEKIADYKKAGVKISFADKPANRRVYNVGLGFGKLSLLEKAQDVKEAVAKGAIGESSIIVTGEDLGELPPVAGIISAKPVTEASHLVLLAQMYGVPFVYEKDALKTYQKDNEKYAYLKTNENEEDTFEYVGSLTEIEIAQIKKLKMEKKLNIIADWNENQIVEVKSLPTNAVAAYGGKGSKYGLIRRTIPENTQTTVLAIPIYYYKQFLKTSKTADGVILETAVLNEYSKVSPASSYSEIDKIASNIREMMKKAIIDENLFKLIRDKITKEFPVVPESGPGRVKLRSSSNVEDGAEFNGAGLYESEGVCYAKCEKDDFNKGLIKVWKSLYTTRGLWARRQFHVDEKNVGMGIVVQRPYKGELANGVVRFSLPDSEYLSFQMQVLGVRGEDDSVTNAEDGGANEKVIMTSKGSMDQLRPQGKSNLPIMEQKQYDTLSDLMLKLYKAWPEKTVKGQTEIEAEWKLIKVNGQLIVHIKQVRAVPRFQEKIVQNGENLFATSGHMEFFGAWPKKAINLLWKPDEVVVNMSPFTINDLKNKKVKIQSVNANILGKPYVFQIKNMASQVKNNSFFIEGSLYNNLFPPISMRISFSSENGFPAVITQDASGLDIQFSGSPLAHLTQKNFIVNESLMANEDGEDYKFRYSDKKCPIKIEGAFKKMWFASGQNLAYFDQVKISGLIAKKSISVKKFGAAYSANAHDDSLRSVFVDLYEDASLKDSDKKSLNARYFNYTDEYIELLDANLKRVKVFNQCASSSSDLGEED